MEIKITHPDQNIEKFFNDLDTESDRGVAILSHAYLDELLKEILKQRLVKNDHFFKNLKYRSFWQKLRLCELLE